MEMKSSNPNALSALSVNLKALASKEGKVGWLDTSHYENGRPVAAVAAGNEFGIPSRSIPARPFMRPAIAENQKTWADIAARGAEDIIAGKTDAETVMGVLVQSAFAAVEKNIVTLTAPPLSPITLGVRKYKQQGKEVTGKTIGEIARKLKEGKLDVSGVNAKPLNDTGMMLAQLTGRVEDANS